MNAPFSVSALLPGEIIIDSVAGVSRGLELRHTCLQLTIIRWSVGAEVHASMAVRAQRDDVRRMIRAAIAHAAKVVRLEIRRTVRPLKGRVLYTALACSLRTRENIGSDVPASAEHVTHGLRWRKHRLRGFESSCPQRVEIAGDYPIFVVYDGRDPIERTELENECVARLVIAVGLLLYAIASTDVLTLEPKRPVIGLSEEQQALPGGGMLSDGAVALVHDHGPDLPLADVFEDPVISLEIDVAVIEALLARDQDHERVLSRCDDAALLLPTIGLVDVSPPTVSSASLKGPRHHAEDPRRLAGLRLRGLAGARNRPIGRSPSASSRRRA